MQFTCRIHFNVIEHKVSSRKLGSFSLTEVNTMNENISELSRDEYTEFIYDKTCFGTPTDPHSAEDVTEGIKLALELDERPVFLE